MDTYLLLFLYVSRSIHRKMGLIRLFCIACVMYQLIGLACKNMYISICDAHGAFCRDRRLKNASYASYTAA
ncbi:hypothetical protein K458DRAFT_478486, partial [Lentithecium fluviatile CBS 122367]